MRVFLGIPSQASGARVLTIGNFDGMHLGHQAMLHRLKAKAAELGVPSAVMTFEPHPREFFAPHEAPARLSSLREKLALLDACGVDEVFVLRFNQAAAALSAADFVRLWLVERLQVRHLIVGDDFRFGAGRQGSFSFLSDAGKAFGFAVDSLDTIETDGLRVSSSAVREALAQGDLQTAEHLLGRPFSIAGRVVHGDKIGRSLGFPTANVQLKRKRVPLSGVYAVTVSGLDKRALPGAANVGIRPTVKQGLRPVLEVHLLDFAQDVYGAHVTVHFLHRLRAEQKFDSFAALKAQIACDVAATQDYFSGKKAG